MILFDAGSSVVIISLCEMLSLWASLLLMTFLFFVVLVLLLLFAWFDAFVSWVDSSLQHCYIISACLLGALLLPIIACLLNEFIEHSFSLLIQYLLKLFLSIVNCSADSKILFVFFRIKTFLSYLYNFLYAFLKFILCCFQHYLHTLTFLHFFLVLTHFFIFNFFYFLYFFSIFSTYSFIYQSCNYLFTTFISIRFYPIK